MRWTPLGCWQGGPPEHPQEMGLSYTWFSGPASFLFISFPSVTIIKELLQGKEQGAGIRLKFPSAEVEASAGSVDLSQQFGH